MDIKLEKKKGWRALFQKKNLPYAFAGAFVIFVAWLLLRDNASTLRVDADVVTVSEVRGGEFNDYVRLTGTVQPITTVQLSPLESGIVERIVAEEGEADGDIVTEAAFDDDDDLASEELAEIYLSQGLKDMAKETYRKLSLLNPEKSVYFAELIAKIENN